MLISHKDSQYCDHIIRANNGLKIHTENEDV